MVCYPVAVAAHCRGPLLLPHRTPSTTTALFRGHLLLPLSQSRPPPSSARRPWGRRHAVDPDDDDVFLTLDLDELEGPDGDVYEEGSSPWEGALVYRRDAAALHVEYATTLERLSLADLSTPHSRALAAAMGIAPFTRTKLPLDDGAETTPVLVAVDVTRRRGRLRLDGIVRTVLTLGCYRCAEPAPQPIFANFSLLLTEDPVEEPDMVDLGTIYEEDATKFPSVTGSQDEDDQDIDWDDRVHFPAGEKEVDISKHIRDIIHLEITLDAFCSTSCKGLCLTCGVNLNTGSCGCGEEEPRDKDAKRSGTMKSLLKPLQDRR